MTFGTSLRLRLDKGGYSLVSEFLTSEGRMAVRLQDHGSKETFSMFLTDAVELTRGVTTEAAIRFRNRAVVFAA